MEHLLDRFFTNVIVYEVVGILTPISQMRSLRPGKVK